MTAQQEQTATLAERYAGDIAPLLADARKAFGSQAPGSPARRASDRVNELVLGYTEAGGKMPALAAALGDEISLSGLRRRVRLARAGNTQGASNQAELGQRPATRGDTDIDRVKAAADSIAAAREQGGAAYGQAVRAAYDEGIALQPIADMLGVSYFAIWSAKRTAY